MRKNNIVEQALQSINSRELTPMQKECLDCVGHDCVLLSPTGSGKTLAFLLYLLNSIDMDRKGIKAIVISPTRELSIQIDGVLKNICRDIKSCCCYGGHSLQEEKGKLITNDIDVVVGTVGRVLDHIEKGNIITDNIDYLVIDEFDKALELGFMEDMMKISNHLSFIKNTLLSSATYSEENTHFFINREDCKIIDYRNDTEDRLQLMSVISDETDKINTLYKLLCYLKGDQSIIFCNHRESVDRVYDMLKSKKISIEKYHGGMDQIYREKSLYKFMNKCCVCLVSTDLAARGLDIPDVSNIIHYHLPIDQACFTHRNGRTARWNAKGSAYIIINNKDKTNHIDMSKAVDFVIPDNLPKPPKPKLKTLYIGKGKKEKISKGDIAGFLYKKGSLSKDDIGHIEIYPNYSLVAINSDKINNVIKLIRGEKLKGIKTVFEEAY